GPWEIALILAIVLILFGPKKLPELAKALGDSIRQYRLASEGVSTTPTTATSTQPPQFKPRESELLIETAKKLGIQTEGKTMDQISREITETASQSTKK
ncbi:MAG: twin-arginine translocase TatA/TatE family subunit, partial [Candidatus Bathyarchaeia archaeon]